jgi:hypothetical protein
MALRFFRRGDGSNQILERNVKGFVNGYLSVRGNAAKYPPLNSKLGRNLRSYINIKRVRNAGIATASVQAAGGPTRLAGLAAEAAFVAPPAQAPAAVAQRLGEEGAPPKVAANAIANLLSVNNSRLNTDEKLTSEAARLMEIYQNAWNKVNPFNYPNLSAPKVKLLAKITNIRKRRFPARPPPPPPPRREGLSNAIRGMTIRRENPFAPPLPPRPVPKLPPPPPGRPRTANLAAAASRAAEIRARRLEGAPMKISVNGTPLYTSKIGSTNYYSKKNNSSNNYYRINKTEDGQWRIKPNATAYTWNKNQGNFRRKNVG